MSRLSTPRKLTTTAVAIAALTGSAVLVPLGLSQAQASPSATVVYDATPSPLPPNVASLGFEATSTSEFGDLVNLSGSSRSLSAVTVTMSDWALYSDYSSDPRYMGDSTNWTHPITVNIYNNHVDGNGVPDQLITSTTQAVTIPWRPAADPTCPGGTAWRASDNGCYNGFAFNATFDLSTPSVILPAQVIVGVAYNTADYGAAPIHQAGPYNSLNVGIPSNQTVTVGSDVNVDNVFWDTTYPGYSAGFREDTGWAPNGTVAFKITTAGAYTFTGFGPPVNNNGVENIAVAGQTIPLKFRVTDNGVPVTDLTSSSVSVTADSLACAGLGITADQVEEYASGGSGLINQGDGYYQFNWKTPKTYAKSCKTLSVNVGDGVDHTAIFRFTK